MADAITHDNSILTSTNAAWWTRIITVDIPMVIAWFYQWQAILVQKWTGQVPCRPPCLGGSPSINPENLLTTLASTKEPYGFVQRWYPRTSSKFISEFISGKAPVPWSIFGQSHAWNPGTSTPFTCIPAEFRGTGCRLWGTSMSTFWSATARGQVGSQPTNSTSDWSWLWEQPGYQGFDSHLGIVSWANMVIWWQLSKEDVIKTQNISAMMENCEIHIDTPIYLIVNYHYLWLNWGWFMNKRICHCRMGRNIQAKTLHASLVGSSGQPSRAVLQGLLLSISVCCCCWWFASLSIRFYPCWLLLVIFLLVINYCLVLLIVIACGPQ